MKKSYLAVLISMVSTGIVTPSITHAAVVDIDLSTQHYIGNTSQLKRNKFFNIHTTAGEPGLAEMDLLFIKNELNADYGRSFWGPFAASGTTDYPSTDYAMTKGAEAVENAKNAPSYPYRSNRIVATEHPSSVIKEGRDIADGARWAADYFENYYDDDIRPLFYEPMNEPFVHASDFVPGPWDNAKNQEMQEHMAAWFSEIGREFDNRGINTNVIGFSSAWPSFELNDFSHWESRQKMFMDVAGDNMDAFAFHLYDGVNVTGQDNFRSGANAEAIIDLIETYSAIKWDEVKPHAVTEYGGIIDGYPIEYSAEKSSQELRSYNHILFSLLSREDRILTSIPFITGSAKWFYDANNFNPYSATVFRPDPDKIVAGKVSGFLPTEKAKFYQLWSEVKGHRVDIEVDDTDIAAQAFVYNNKVYLALNNFEDSAKNVSLNFMNDGNEVKQVRVKRLNVPYGETAIYSDEVANSAPSQISLADHETVILEYTLASPITHDRISRTQNYYSDTHLQPIVANSEIEFTFNDVALNQETLTFTDAYAEGFVYDQAVVDAIPANQIRRYQSALRSYENVFKNILRKYPDTWKESADYQRLVVRAGRSAATQTALQLHYSQNGYNDTEGNAVVRMSISRKHDKSKQPVLLVNGHAVAVPTDWKGYDQAERADFFGTIEIPVPAKFLKANNTMSFAFSDSDGRISSVILEVETKEEYKTVAVESVQVVQSDVAINKDKDYRLKANVMPLNASNQAITWASSNPSVATVNSDGIVTPVMPGNTSITATTVDGGLTSTTSLEVKDEITLRNTVVVTNEIADLPESDTYSFEIDYSTNVDRDISVEVYSPSNQWLGLSKVTVPAGEGKTTVNLTLAQPLTAGVGYRFITSLRAVGGDWRTSVDGHTFNNVAVVGEGGAEPDPSNLLGANSGFEYGDLTDWSFVWDSVGTATVDPVAAKDGDYGVLIDTTNGKVGLSLSDTVLPQGLIKLGKKYKLSYDIKRVSGSGWAGGFAYFVNTDGGWKSTASGPWFGTSGLNQWIHVEKEIDGLDWSDVQTALEINFQTAGQQWYLDNIKLEDLTPVVEPEPEVEVNTLEAVNPSFETGDIAPWGGYWENNDTTVISVVESAKSDQIYGVNIVSDGNKNTGLSLNSTIAPQDLGLGLGKQYKISFDIRSNASGGSGYLRSVVQGQWGTRIESWFDFGTDWKTVEFIRDDQDWTAFENQGRIDLYIHANGGAGLDFDVDNIKIVEVVPE